jgi:acyl-CoA reductase-like NAD-dependent aldehyde dehydrogenase
VGEDGEVLARPARASRKDLRDAVRAARSAFPKWSGTTAYNRGQVLYRVAELLEGRRAQFEDELAAFGAPKPAREVEAAIDRWVWYAGWSDKVHHVMGTVNPVAGPYYDFTFPEPTGVVGVVAPEEPALLGLVSRLAPAIVSGNTVVLVASERRPLPAVTLSEVLATSDVPGGVVNVLTGLKQELLSWLAGHMDVNAVDLTGATEDAVPDLERASAENVKRVVRDGSADWFADEAQSLYAVTALMEMKTVWHPMGA